MPTAVAVFELKDGAWLPVFTNRAFCAVAPGKLGPLSKWEFLSPELRLSLGESMSRVLTTVSSVDLGTLDVKLDGKRGRPHHGLLLPCGSGAVALLLSDVSEWAARKAELLREEGLYRSLVEHQTELLFKLDSEMRLEFVSPAFCRLFGKAPKDLVGQPFLTHVYDEDQPLLQATLLGLAQPPHEQALEHRSRTRVGWRWLAVSYRARLDESGKVAGVFGVGRDVTMQKLAEEEIRLSEATLNAALDSVPYEVWVTDEDGRFLRSNLASRFHFGEIAGSRPEELGLPSEVGEQFATVVDGALGGQTMEAEIELQRAESPRQLRLLAAPIRSESRVTGTVGIGMDITAERQAQREHEELQQQLLAVQKLESLGLLSGGIAHDFNNFLCAIIANADLALKAIGPDAAGKRNITDLVTVAEQAAGLCQQLLAYSGHGRFVIEPVNLSDLIVDMRPLLDVSVSKGVTMRWALAPRLPAVLGDSAQLRQIVMNLVTNAAEALKGGRGNIEVSTSLVEADTALLSKSLAGDPPAEGTYVSLQVSDDGQGMNPETVQRIFDPFFTTKFKGRGLGLAATLGIIRGHHGAILVESQLGRGSRFAVLLPPTTDFPVSSEARPPAEEWSGQGLVLVVDDTPAVRQIARRALESFGFEVLEAVDGLDALRLHQELVQPLRFVLLDLTMPNLNGQETFFSLRERDPTVPVLLTSGYSEQQSMLAFAGQAWVGFVQKPFHLAMLRNAVRRLLGE